MRLKVRTILTGKKPVVEIKPCKCKMKSIHVMSKSLWEKTMKKFSFMIFYMHIWFNRKKCILIVAVCWTLFPTTSSLPYIHRSLLNLCNLSNDIDTAAYMLQQCHDIWDSFVLILLYYYQLYWIKHSRYLKNKAVDSDLGVCLFLIKLTNHLFLYPSDPSQRARGDVLMY